MITKEKINQALETYKDGFTLDLKTGEFIENGFAVALTHNINLKDLETLYKTVVTNQHVLKCVGGWTDQKDHIHYLDFVLIVNNEQDALKLCEIFRQIAYFDLNNLKEVRV